jgi:hypothetical protein
MNKGASSCVFCRPGNRRSHKTRKNWHLSSYYVHWVTLAIQLCVEKSAQCDKMTTGTTGLKTCVLRTDE